MKPDTTSDWRFRAIAASAVVLGGCGGGGEPGTATAPPARAGQVWEVQASEDRANIHDPAHFAYPTYAKAAIQRRQNLKHSADELKVQLNDAKDALAEAFEELKKVELLDERDQMRERAAEAALEQSEFDAIGLMRTTRTSPA